MYAISGILTVPNPDSDGDGVNDDDDLCPGTPAGEPVDANGCADAQVDSDGDGLCSPSAPSDGPSMCTGDEGMLGTDPNDPDTDNDGLLDGTEVDSAMGSGCPNPLNADSDNDTLLDGAEVTAGTNPCEADTDGDGLPDNVDPTPTDPGATSGFLEQFALDLADTIRDLDLSVFNGPSANANKGRSNALAKRAMDAATAIAAGDIQGAIDSLNGRTPARNCQPYSLGRHTKQNCPVWLTGQRGSQIR